MRINVALVQVGFANSRRGADELVKNGKVTLNGEKISDFSTQVIVGDMLSVEGVTKQLGTIVQQLILLNKPIGYTCSHKAQRGQKTIFDLLPQDYHHYKIAGRLDIDSHGLLLLANSGHLSHKIIHPSQRQLKYYRVTVKEKITSAQLARLGEAINIQGKVVRAQGVEKKSAYIVEIAISQGINRQVRHMFGKVGLTVTDLIRIRIGAYHLGNLPEGQWRLVHV